MQTTPDNGGAPAEMPNSQTLPARHSEHSSLPKPPHTYPFLESVLELSLARRVAPKGTEHPYVVSLRKMAEEQRSAPALMPSLLGRSLRLSRTRPAGHRLWLASDREERDELRLCAFSSSLASTYATARRPRHQLQSHRRTRERTGQPSPRSTRSLVPRTRLLARSS